MKIKILWLQVSVILCALSVLAADSDFEGSGGNTTWINAGATKRMPVANIEGSTIHCAGEIFLKLPSMKVRTMVIKNAHEDAISILVNRDHIAKTITIKVENATEINITAECSPSSSGVKSNSSTFGSQADAKAHISFE